MGETTVAVAHALLDDFRNAAFFVDLSTLTDAALLPLSIASALGFQAPVQAPDPMSALLAFLAGHRLIPLSEVRCRLEFRIHNIAGPVQTPSRFLIDDLACTDRVKNARQAVNIGGGIAVEDDEIGVKSFLYAALL